MSTSRECLKNYSEKIIEIDNLWKSFNGLEVLKGLTLTVYKGETLVILGRSGEGKSVLLRLISGIEVPDSGFIEVEGKNLFRISSKEKEGVTKKMGLLFQGGALFDSMNVGENVAFYLRQHQSDLSDKEISERVRKALKKVSLEGTENKMPSDLSGGMRKRVALARVIVYQPLIILYDEPTTGLDPVTAMQINDLIRQTQNDLKATTIVVTHDLRSSLVVGDRLAFLHEGKIIQVAEKEKFLKIKDPSLNAFFINAIVTEELLDEKIRS